MISSTPQCSNHPKVTDYLENNELLKSRREAASVFQPSDELKARISEAIAGRTGVEFNIVRRPVNGSVGHS